MALRIKTMETMGSDPNRTEREIQFFRDLSTDPDSSGLDLVLMHYDAASKAAVFEYFWEKLQASYGDIDIATLRLCVRLLPVENVSDS